MQTENGVYMKALALTVTLLLIPVTHALANCDISTFRWECDIPAMAKPTEPARSLVVCGNTALYVSKAQHDLIANYQRADINMIFTINGEYIDSPCVPSGRYGPNYF